MLRLNSRGDTIVEVLIASTIVGSILVGAFITVNRTLGNSRLAQEHAEALKLAESQVEALKGLRSQSQLFDTASYQFCVRDDNVTPVHFTSSDTYDKSRADDATYYPADCMRTAAGGYKYSVSVHKNGTDNNKFYVNVDWYSREGTLNDVGLIYALYQ